MSRHERLSHKASILMSVVIVEQETKNCCPSVDINGQKRGLRCVVWQLVANPWHRCKRSSEPGYNHSRGLPVHRNMRTLLAMFCIYMLFSRLNQHTSA